MVWVKHVGEHGSRNARRFGPVPIWQSELRIAAEIAQRHLQPPEISAVPDKKPPVPVRAVKYVEECVAIPVAWIRWGQRQHLAYPSLVAREDARRHRRIGDLPSAELRALCADNGGQCIRGDESRSCAQKPTARQVRQTSIGHGFLPRSADYVSR